MKITAISQSFMALSCGWPIDITDITCQEMNSWLFTTLFPFSGQTNFYPHLFHLNLALPSIEIWFLPFTLFIPIPFFSKSSQIHLQNIAQSHCSTPEPRTRPKPSPLLYSLQIALPFPPLLLCHPILKLAE